MSKRKRVVNFVEDDTKRFKPLSYKREISNNEALMEKQQVLIEKMFKCIKKLEERVGQLEEMVELESYQSHKHIYF